MIAQPPERPAQPPARPAGNPAPVPRPVFSSRAAPGSRAASGPRPASGPPPAPNLRRGPRGGGASNRRPTGGGPAPTREHEILFQKYFKSVGPRTYAAQLKRANNGNHFLVLTEGKRDESTGEVRKTRLFVYSEDFLEFFKMLQDTSLFIRAHPVPDDVRQRRDRFWKKRDAEAKAAPEPRPAPQPARHDGPPRAPSAPPPAARMFAGAPAARPDGGRPRGGGETLTARRRRSRGNGSITPPKLSDSYAHSSATSSGLSGGSTTAR